MSADPCTDAGLPDWYFSSALLSIRAISAYERHKPTLPVLPSSYCPSYACILTVSPQNVNFSAFKIKTNTLRHLFTVVGRPNSINKNVDYTVVAALRVYVCGLRTLLQSAPQARSAETALARPCSQLGV